MGKSIYHRDSHLKVKHKQRYKWQKRNILDQHGIKIRCPRI